MTRNKRPQNSFTPIRLEIDGTLYGHYMDAGTARAIAESGLKSGDAQHYRIFRGDQLVDEGG